jgi:glycosyltransferase involved in cell wall biosynthesis/GT2 family glycosyltransferase
VNISVVICTLNRAEELQRTIASFALQRYRDFELIVVDGPSDDRTAEVMNAWRRHIKIARCPEPNLSMSRNIGIAEAAGDVVAFIDDDAIPEPFWLENIAAGYSAPDIGAVGGWVHDSTGYDYQTKYILSNRFGASRTEVPNNPTAFYNCPGAVEYCGLLGTNSSFRRDLLVEIGGFDEEFAYYLDETDVCLRLVDRGYRIVFVENARVLHKFAPGPIRNARKILHNRYQIIKNQCYFSFLHGAPAEGYAKALNEIENFVRKHRDDVKWCVDAGLLDPQAGERFEVEVEDALRDGLTRALSGTPSHRPIAYFQNAKPFLGHDVIGVAQQPLTIVIVSQSYPPGYVDGIGRFTAELAAGLAELGHEVHVVTSSRDYNRVDLEDLVWVHRVLPLGEEARDPDVPGGIWAKSAAAVAEILRIAETSKIDIVQAPNWDAEGIAALRKLRNEAVFITSLHTPMLVACANHPNWLADQLRMTSEILPIMRLERELFLFSDGIYANSQDIVGVIEHNYNVLLENVSIVPHGMRDRLEGKGKTAVSPQGPEAEAQTQRLRILFVGRLETRKGIDVVLDAIPRICEVLPHAEFWFIGQDHTEGADGESSVGTFRRRHGGQNWMSQITFFGKVDQEFLDNYYSECDVVVMPSRYESFGLVLLEAMMHGLPVVAAHVGGMKEVVLDGETGFLPPPGDVEAFAESVIALGRDPQLRKTLGENGRHRFEGRFTAKAMAEKSVEMYGRLLSEKRRGGLATKRIATPKTFPLCRPWTISDFWHESPLRSWIDRDWFFPAAPIWIALLAREAIFRNGSSGSERKTVIIGSSEPDDFVESVFPGAFKIARQDLANRGIWADSSVPHRQLSKLGLRDQDCDTVVVFKPLPRATGEQIAAVSEFSRILRTSGVLAFLTDQPLDDEVAACLKRLGFQSKEFEIVKRLTSKVSPSVYSVVVTRSIVPNAGLGPPQKQVRRSLNARAEASG